MSGFTIAASTYEQPEPSGDWEFLSHWEQVNENDLSDGDIIHDSEGSDEFESEDEDDPMEPSEQFGKEPMATEVQVQSKLTGDQITDIINEQIEHYTNAWQPNHGVLKGDEVAYDPENMWQEAETSGERYRLIHKYSMDTAYYKQRLDKLCDEILKAPGRSAERVRFQCRNLEITIHSLELSEWLLSIYSSDPATSSDHDNEEHLLLPGTGSSIIDLGSPPASSSPTSTLSSHVTVMASPAVSYGEDPQNASIASVRHWMWDDLINARDRKRIVSKALSELTREELEMVRTRVKTVGKAEISREATACIRMLAKNESKMPGILRQDLHKVVIFTRLILCWWLCDNCFRTNINVPELHVIELEHFLQEDKADVNILYVYLNMIMSTTFDPEALQHPERPSQSEIIEISDDEDMVD
ncbi:hypothetical protein ACEQ8H_003041 [Pleosporales sp. CAS-2024a]